MKTFRFTCDITFKAKTLDEAIAMLAEHFKKPDESELGHEGKLHIRRDEREWPWAHIPSTVEDGAVLHVG